MDQLSLEVEKHGNNELATAMLNLKAREQEAFENLTTLLNQHNGSNGKAIDLELLEDDYEPVLKGITAIMTHYMKKTDKTKTNKSTQ